MKTCPHCGAENLQTAASCRLCATPIESPQDLLGVRADVPFTPNMPPAIVVSGKEPANQHAPASSYAGHTVCPVCQTVNESNWLYCQHCGHELPRPEAHSARMDEQSKGAESKDHQGPAGVPRTRDPMVAPQAAKGNYGLDTNPNEVVVRPKDSPPPTALICKECGNREETGSLFCTNCGSRLAPVEKERIEKRPAAVLQLITEGGDVGDTYTLDRDETAIGRVHGDITFSYDGYMSSRHARIIRRDNRYFLVDDNSRNGTYIRITGEVKLEPGDMILIGKQVFKFDKST